MRYKHVVICGGGFSGLLAALTCAKQAERVTVIEPFPDGQASQYAGTPQSHHVHIMAAKGQALLEQLLPGFLDELRRHGAVEVDWAEHTAWHGPFGRCPNYVSGIKSLLFSRKLIEKLLMLRVQREVTVCHAKAAVRDLVISEGRVQAIILSHGDRVTDIDLCIEARGRTSRLKETIEAHVGPIPQRTIENRLRYLSTVVEHQFAPSDAIVQHYRQANAKTTPLGYFASPIEGQRVIFTAVDYHGNIAKPFEQLQTHPLLQGKQLGVLRGFTKLHNQHTRYGKAKTWINNLVVIGDAVCRLNPVYGHGLTICLEHVELLHKALSIRGGIKTHRLQKQVDRTIRASWSLVEIDEMRAQGRSPHLVYRLIHAYLDRLAKAATMDPAVHKVSLQVLHRIKSPLALMAPGTVWRAMRQPHAHLLALGSQRLTHLGLKAPGSMTWISEPTCLTLVGLGIICAVTLSLLPTTVW